MTLVEHGARTVTTGRADGAVPSALREQMQRYDDRDFELWSAVMFACLLLGIGFVGVLVPDMMWDAGSVTIQVRNLPQLILGLVALVSLFAIYMVTEHRKLRAARVDCMEQYLRAEQAVQESFIDPLTGVFNRRYMELLLQNEASRVDRSGGTFALLMMDVNDFKGINTRNGHLEGDRILQELAHLIRTTFRQYDSVIRYGGDEFLVVMPDTNEAQCQSALARLQARVLARRTSGTSPVISLSCGVACYSRGETIENVLRLSDERMYACKTSDFGVPSAV